MRLWIAAIALALTSAALSGCVAPPRLCPPGTHPGPYGHRCFLN